MIPCSGPAQSDLSSPVLPSQPSAALVHLGCSSDDHALGTPCLCSAHLGANGPAELQGESCIFLQEHLVSRVGVQHARLPAEQRVVQRTPKHWGYGKGTEVK